LTVVRILAGSPTVAAANVLTGSGNFYTGSASPGATESDSTNTSFKLHTLSEGLNLNNKKESSGTSTAATSTITITVADVDNIGQGDVISLISTSQTTITCTLNGVGGTTTSATTDGNVEAATFASGTDNTLQATSQAVAIANAINYNNLFTATNSANVVTVTQVDGGSAGNTAVTLTEIGQTGMTKTNFTGGLDGTVGTNNLLVSGSKDNVRWEISSTNPNKGTFTLLIRRGNDTIKRKQTLETWKNVTLDQNSSNYISKIIGDQYWTLNQSGGTDPYLSLSGQYRNNSKYVRVEVLKNTVDYLDSNGNVRSPAASASLPGLGSGSYGGSFSGGTDGTESHPKNFYQNITDTNSQGLNLNVAGKGKTAYEDAINLLGNADEYDINLVLMPGVVDNGTGGGSLITKAVDMCEDRGDCFVIADPTFYDASITTATAEAEARDSSYAATYWPWVQISDPDLGKNPWVPPSVAMAGVYSFNDKVAHPWFAPAGLNRGVIDSVVQTERKLTHANRDTLYDSNVNPIATFPGQGVCVWGQKTLQKKLSALDRVNVRRLLIKVKKFIASTSRFLVFEQNNSATRSRFLNIANPYLEQIQSNSGLSTFRIVMDETNNTPDLVDRNILYGQIFLQPTRTAEFIVLDFTVQPTGATFPE
jgi:hypothetical protein